MADNRDVDFFGALGRAVVFVPTLLARLLLGAIVVFKYWHWFVVPVLRPSFDVGVLQTIGLMMFAGVVVEKWAIPRTLTPAGKAEDKLRYKKQTVGTTLAAQLVVMGVVLLVGWLAKTYVVGPDPAWLTALVS